MKFYSWLALLGFFILYHGVLLMCIVLYSVQVNLNLQAPQLVLFLFYTQAFHQLACIKVQWSCDNNLVHIYGIRNTSMKNIQWLQCSKLGTTKSLKAWINIEISTINSMIIYLITMWRWYNWLFGCKHDELKSSIEKFTCNHSTFSRASPDQGRGESIGSRLYNHTQFVQCLVPNPPSTNPLDLFPIYL